MKDQELISPKRELRVSPPLVVGELDFEDPWSKAFDNSAHLSTAQAPFGKIGGERNYIEELDSWSHMTAYNT